MVDATDEHVIVDEEVEDTGVLPAEDSQRSDDAPTDDKSTTEKSDPDPLSEESDEDLEEELATAGKPPVDPAAPAAAAPEKAPATPAPFTYKGDKGEQALEGAQYYAGDGLYIPDALVPKVKQLLATAAVHNGSWQREKRELTRAIEQAQKGRNEKDVAADALMDLVFKDLGTLEDDNDIYEWAVNFRKNLPTYRHAIKEKQLLHREKELEQRSLPDPEAVEAEAVELATREVTTTMDEIFKRPEFKVLDDEDRKELRTRYTAKARNYLSIADRDYPDHDLKKGDAIFDGAALLEEMQVAAAIKQRTVSAAEAARQAAEANRRKLGKPVPGAARAAAPAASSSTATEGAPRDSKTGRFKNRDDYEEWMRSHEE